VCQLLSGQLETASATYQQHRAVMRRQDA
jgi:hypothetical protein